MFGTSPEHRKVRKHTEIYWLMLLQTQESDEAERNILVNASPDKESQEKQGNIMVQASPEHRTMRKHKEI